MDSVVVLTGGGIKGAVAASSYAADHATLLVHADYGQPSARAETKAVESLSRTWANCRCVSVKLTCSLERQLTESESDSETGTARTADQTAPSAGTLRGIVPVLLSLGLQYALRVGARTVVTGLSRFCPASHLGFNDAGRSASQFHEILQAFDTLAESLSYASQRSHFAAPLMELGGAGIVKLGKHLNVPLEVARSCNSGAAIPCGRCEGCQHRTDSFVQAGLADPALVPRPA